MMKRKSGKDRLLMGFSMFNFSSSILLSSIQKNLSPAEKKKEIFLRLYKNDFSKDKQKDILESLMRHMPINTINSKQ